MKNGGKIAVWDRIQQQFYCPAISLYNYAKVELRYREDQMQYLPEGHKPYVEIYEEEILY